MSTRLQHTCIRASAGTGKTHQLANRYLALLLLQAMGGGKISPDRLVAVTFTRKGAGEFAERILRRLAAGAGDDEARELLMADLSQLVKGDPGHGIEGLAPGVDLTVNASVLRTALAVTIDQFDRLVLGTIDSFMARSVQTLAFELGLGGFEILEEAAIALEREELLGEVFRMASERDLKAFYQTLKGATLKSSSSLRRELSGFVEDYHKLIRSMPQAEAWGGSAFWGGSDLKRPGASWRQEAAALAGRVATQELGHRQLNKSIVAALEWLASRTPGTRAGPLPSWIGEDGKLAELWPDWPEGNWEFEYSRKCRTIPACLMSPLKSILESWVAAECAALSGKTAAIHALVSDYEQLYERLARRKGRLTFDDLPVLLDERNSTDSAADAIRLLAFRWYQQFDHWMLDEFQDTSRIQWGVLRPWLDETIQDSSGTKSVFVVGDPKQSIYGWRGGEPRLFDELTDCYPEAFRTRVMAESWRSRPSVLELVNRVCAPATNPALRDPDEFSPAALARWHYDPHSSETRRQEHPGYAAVLLAPNAEPGDGEPGDGEPGDGEPGDGGAEGGGDDTGGGGDLADPLASQAKVIKAVLQDLDPLGEGLSCAILVRKNKNAQAIAQWLRAHGVAQVMVEGVATLADQSPVVAALVDALRWLAVPANELAAGHIRSTRLWDVLREPWAGQEDGGICLENVWRHWRQRIAEVGAPPVTQEWCDQLASGNPDAYARYCVRQVAQTAQLAGPAVALPEWLATLEQLTVRETAAAGFVHIMTIHKAKGLGFDVVFLPDLDRSAGRRDEVLVRRDGQGHPLGCLSYPPKWLQVWMPALQSMCAAQRAEQDLEALCLLYVALTRAREATFVILNKDRLRGASRAREWLMAAFSNPATAVPGELAPSPWGGAELGWQHGSCKLVAGRKDQKTTVAPPVPELTLPTPAPRRERRRPSNAGHEHVAEIRPGTAPGGGQEFGTAVHKVFEQVEWWTPGQTLEGADDAVTRVRKCMEMPEIRALFTQATEADEAHRELPLEFVEGNSWWSGVVDRLVLRRDAGGTLRKAVLIDFKTDRVGTLATLRDCYAEQMAVYRRAICSALNLACDQVETHLLSTHMQALLQL